MIHPFRIVLGGMKSALKKSQAVYATFLFAVKKTDIEAINYDYDKFLKSIKPSCDGFPGKNSRPRDSITRVFNNFQVQPQTNFAKIFNASRSVV